MQVVRKCVTLVQVYNEAPATWCMNAGLVLFLQESDRVLKDTGYICWYFLGMEM